MTVADPEEFFSGRNPTLNAKLLDKLEHVLLLT
jgi:hypothetical protein